MPVASIDGPDRFDFWTRNVWGEVETRMLDAIGALGALPDGGDPALAQATAAARQSARLRQQLLPFRPKKDQPGFTSPVAYGGEDDDGFRAAWPAGGDARRRPAARVVAMSAPGMYDTHDNQPQELADGLKLTADSLLAFQRDLEARGLADRVLVHVWSEFGRRAKENGSNGTDHGAAGAGFLIGARASGRMIGEFPGSQASTGTATCAPRRTSAASTARCSSSGSAPTREAIIPGARKFARPAVLVIATSLVLLALVSPARVQVSRRTSSATRSRGSRSRRGRRSCSSSTTARTSTTCGCAGRAARASTGSVSRDPAACASSRRSSFRPVHALVLARRPHAAAWPRRWSYAGAELFSGGSRS